MQMSLLAKKLLVLAAVLTVSGCEILRVNETADKNRDAAKNAQTMVDSLRNEVPGKRKVGSFSSGQWVSKTPIDMTSTIPPLKDCPGVGFNKTMDLLQFASWVTQTCGFKVKVTQDALDGGASLSAANSRQAAQQPSVTPSIQPVDSLRGLFPQTSGNGTGYTGASYSSAPYISGVNYEGTLSGLLDTVTTRLGLSWRYNPKQELITISYFETRQFKLWVFDMNMGIKSQINAGMQSVTSGNGNSGGMTGSNGGSSSNGDSGSTQSVTMEMKDANIVTDVENNVRSMMSPNGKLGISRTTGTITVTDRADVLDSIGEYIARENKTLTTNILFNVEVVSVSLTDKDQFAVNMDAVYRSASAAFGLSNAFPGVDSSASNASVGIVDSSSSPWAGSKAVIQALSQQGTISGYRAPSVRTLNLQTAPIQIGKLQGYVQSSSSTQTANVGSTGSLNPGTITSGFNMLLYPKIIEDGSGDLLLRVTAYLSADPNFKTYETKDGNSLIQTPSFDLQNFDQSVKLKSGQTLILTGYDQSLADTNKQGTGTASNFLLGGGASRNNSRDVIVFIITPIISS